MTDPILDNSTLALAIINQFISKIIYYAA
jgi:hypothetical protein